MPRKLAYRNLPQLFLRAREELLCHFRPIITHFGLTEQQWRILRTVNETGQLEPREICEICQILSPSLTGVFTFIVQLATATALLLYVLCPLAALRFMSDGRIPRSGALQVASVGALAFSAIAIIGSGVPAMAWGTGLIAAGWPLYRVMRRAVVAA